MQDVFEIHVHIGRKICIFVFVGNTSTNSFSSETLQEKSKTGKTGRKINKTKLEEELQKDME